MLSFLGKICSWLLRNILTVAAVTIILCVLSPGIRYARENNDVLVKSRAGVLAALEQVNADITKAHQTLTGKTSLLEHWRGQKRDCDDKLAALPSAWLHPIDHLTASARLNAEKKRLEMQIAALESAQAKASETLQQLNRQKTMLEIQLDGIAGSLADSVSGEWHKHGIRILLFSIFFVLFTPPLWLVFLYYGVAALIEKAPPIHIRLPGENASGNQPVFSKSARSISFEIPPGRTFYLRARGGDWGKERRGVNCRTKFLWRWSAPLVSFAADLAELMAYRGESGECGSVKLTSPVDDEVYIQRIDLNGGNGLVLMPRHVIGLTDDVDVRTVWSFRLHNLISLRLRQIVFYGTGTIFITGGRGIDVQSIQPGSSTVHKIEDGVLIGYVPGAAYSLCRTQTFWAYFRGMTSLLDYRLCGGTFLTQNLVSRSEKEVQGSGLDRFLSVLLNGIGKLLGF